MSDPSADRLDFEDRMATVAFDVDERAHIVVDGAAGDRGQIGRDGQRGVVRRRDGEEPRVKSRRPGQLVDVDPGGHHLHEGDNVPVSHVEGRRPCRPRDTTT